MSVEKHWSQFYSNMPKSIDYPEVTISMPTTPVGKVASKTLENGVIEHRRKNGDYMGENNNDRN